MLLHFWRLVIATGIAAIVFTLIYLLCMWLARVGDSPDESPREDAACHG